jgi:hypothetical protein
MVMNYLGIIRESFHRLQLRVPKAFTAELIDFPKLKNFAYDVRPLSKLI